MKSLFFVIFGIFVWTGCSVQTPGNNVTPAKNPPVIGLDTPSNLDIISNILYLKGTASSDVGLERVEVKVNDAPYAPASGKENWSYQYEFSTNSNQTAVIIARAVDTAGNTGSVSITLNIIATNYLMISNFINLSNTVLISNYIYITNVIISNFYFITNNPAETVTNNDKVYILGQDADGHLCYWFGTNKCLLPDVTANYGYYPVFFIENNIVYIAGRDKSDNLCYWIDGNKTILEYCGNNVFSNTYNSYSHISSIFVDSGVVYTAGQDSSNRGCYWQGINKTVIPDSPCLCVTNINNWIDVPLFHRLSNNTYLSTNTCSIYSWGSYTNYFVTVYPGWTYSNSQYYILTNFPGITSDTYQISNYLSSTNILINTNSYANNLPAYSNNFVQALYVSGGLVYTAGQDNNSSLCYWTGTNKTIIESNRNEGPDWYGNTIKSMWVNNGTVYTLGKDTNMKACYWAGNNKTFLNSGRANPNALFMENGTLYIGGGDNHNNPCYWKGNEFNLIDSSGYLTGVQSIYVLDGTVFSVGPQDYYGNLCYWIGTNKVIMDYQGGYGFSIFATH